MPVISPQLPLILGSGSPRRRDILESLGVPIVVRAASVDESVRANETAEAYVERIVGAKLRAVAAATAGERHAGTLVADTTVVLDGDILGKPENREHAEQLLGRLVGRRHVVLTRYAISVSDDPAVPRAARTVSSEVEMRPAAVDEIRRYAATGEGADKAGSYAVQGIGAFLVRSIYGSWTNVVGLPACEVVLDLRAAGLITGFP